MKKNNVKKLALSRETLVRLDDPKLGFAEGGAWSENSICPTTGPSKGRFCPGQVESDTN